MAVWERDGFGDSTECMERALKEFRERGTQNISSAQKLGLWLQKLSTEKLREMWIIDSEATLQMLVDHFGAEKAFEKYTRFAVSVEDCKKILAEAGYIIFDKGLYEADRKAKAAHTNALEAEREKNFEEVETWRRIAQRAEKNLLPLKIALFDAYTEAGKIELPGYEED